MFTKKDIFKVLKNRDEIGLAYLLEKYPELINKKSLSGYSLLEIAILTKGRNNGILRILIEKGINVNLNSAKMKTPLVFILVRQNNHEIINLMIQHGLNLKIRDSNGYTLLEIAFFYQAKDTLNILKQYTDIKEDLFVLIEQDNNEEFISVFNQNKVKGQKYVNQKKGKYSLIEKAVLSENRTIIEFLISQPHIALNALNRNGYNLSSRLVLPGNEDLLKMFLDKGFQCSAYDKHYCNTLYYALDTQNIKAIKILLEHNVEIYQKKEYSHSEKSNLIKAYQTHNSEIIELIYDYALQKVNYDYNQIYSPYFYFMSIGNFALAEKTRNENPKYNIYETDVHGVNCLHLAVKYKHHKFTDYILSNLDINKLNVADKKGFYPIDYIIHNSPNSATNFLKKLPESVIHPVNKKDNRKEIEEYEWSQPIDKEESIKEFSLLDKSLYLYDIKLFDDLLSRGMNFKKYNIKTALLSVLMNYQIVRITNHVNYYHYDLYNPYYKKQQTQKRMHDKTAFLIHLYNKLHNNIDFSLFQGEDNVLNKACSDFIDQYVCHDSYLDVCSAEEYNNLTFLKIVEKDYPVIYAEFDKLFIRKHMENIEKAQTDITPRQKTRL